MTDIELSNISKKYGVKVVLDRFNLSVQQGEFVCISGESGKGKSTLLNIIGLLDHPDSGDVIIKGIKNPRLQSCTGRNLLRSEIAYIFQNCGLVEDNTVLYNLKIAARFSKKCTATCFEEALAGVGLPKSMLKQKVYELSGGEQQRVALSRLFFKPASVILADEPTGSLDAENRDIVMNILNAFNISGKTLIVVSHDKEVEKCAKRVIKL
jgi:putative ABC transport system ATP-binding protein